MNRRALLQRLPFLAALPFAATKAPPLGAEPLGDVVIKMALGEGDCLPRVSVDDVEYTARTLTVEVEHRLPPIPPDVPGRSWREAIEELRQDDDDLAVVIKNDFAGLDVTR